MKKQKFLVTKRGGIIQTVTAPNGAVKRHEIKEGTIVEGSPSDAQIRGLLKLGFLQLHDPQQPTPKPIIPLAPKRKKADVEIKPSFPDSETKDNP